MPCVVTQRCEHGNSMSLRKGTNTVTQYGKQASLLRQFTGLGSSDASRFANTRVASSWCSTCAPHNEVTKGCRQVVAAGGRGRTVVMSSKESKSVSWPGPPAQDIHIRTPAHAVAHGRRNGPRIVACRRMCIAPADRQVIVRGTGLSLIV